MNFVKYRSLLARGTRALAITLLLLCGVGCHSDESTDTKISQPETTVIECTTTNVVTTTTTTTTMTTTTTTAETTSTMAATQTNVQATSAQIEVQPYVVEPTTAAEVQPLRNVPLSEQDYILIANVISHEAGSSWISTYNRSQIVAAIMNRVADPRFPNTVDGVVHQRGQMFDVPYYRVDYSGIGYAPIDEAIALYFSGQYDYGSIVCWYGNGTENIFYSI